MFHVGEYLVYKRDVCKVEEIKEKYMKEMDYYVLTPIEDPTLTISIPFTNSQIRPLISKERVEEIIASIPSIEVINSEDRMIESEYRNLLNSEDHKDLIRIIKTTYLRNKERLENNKKIGETDHHYFEKAEKYLYDEFSIVLSLSFEEVKQYVVDKVVELEKI